MKLADIKFDCKYFRGEVPCVPNKLRGKICECDEYTRVSKRILIIKLGAGGDVIRSTPLAVKFRSIFPDCHITWITKSPELLPQTEIDVIQDLDFISWQVTAAQEFDIAVNLDKDKEACILLSEVSAGKKFGFAWNTKKNHIEGLTKEAEEKILTGLFDEYSKQNTKSYLQEVFQICGFEFNGEPYLLNKDLGLIDKWSVVRQKAKGKKIVGLNTGCGRRWQTRLWPEEYWMDLIRKLNAAGTFPILLGGPDEDAQNKKYAKETGVYYPGTFSLPEFIAIVANTDVIVTAVSMAMHIAIGLEKKLVLFNNIFNKNEFDLYGRGVILEPTSGCDDYYGNKCTRERHCMRDISVESVLKAVMRCVSESALNLA